MIVNMRDKDFNDWNDFVNSHKNPFKVFMYNIKDKTSFRVLIDYLGNSRQVIRVKPSYTINKVINMFKSLVSTNFSAVKLRLKYNDVILDNYKRLYEYCIGHRDVLNVIEIIEIDKPIDLAVNLMKEHNILSKFNKLDYDINYIRKLLSNSKSKCIKMDINDLSGPKELYWETLIKIKVIDNKRCKDLINLFTNEILKYGKSLYFHSFYCVVCYNKYYALSESIQVQLTHTH